jgi:uncharacterized protein YciI
MLFALYCTDRPASLELRLATRPSHLAYLEAFMGQIMVGGALMDAEGKAAGTMIVIDLPDRAAAEAFAAGDPYAKAGLFEGTIIRPYRPSIKDGAKLG